MIVQITDYGVSRLKETSLPFELTKYKLGSSFGYAPKLDATDILGNLQYEGTPTEYVPINGNTVKYRIALDYEVESFSFGEISLFDDSNKCVAICVASNPIIKEKYESRDIGNSIVIEIFLSMVDGNFVMWTDDLASSNPLSVPIVDSIDLLYPVSQTTSNMYVVCPPSKESTNTSAILAYTTRQGLWNFDVYQLKNTAFNLKILEAQPTAIVFDVSEFTLEQLNDIIPRYFGELILEFTSGPLFSCCRNIKSTVISENKATVSFATPIARPPYEGDTFAIFGRTSLSIADTIFPIATKDSLGAIIPGEGLSINPQGVVDVDFPVVSVNGHTGEVNLVRKDFPWMAKVAETNNYEDLYNKYTLPVATFSTLGGVRPKEGSVVTIDASGLVDLKINPIATINGKAPDENNNIQINFNEEIVGLINPILLEVNNDLNNFTSAGLFYAPKETAPLIFNTPITNNYFTLEVVPMYRNQIGGEVIQRITSSDVGYIRSFNGTSWTPWTMVLTGSTLPIATSQFLGAIRVGNGLSITEDTGILSANVTSVLGKTGDVVFNGDDLFNILRRYINTEGGFPGLTKNEEEDLTPEEKKEVGWKYARIEMRQLPLGTFYYIGTYDPQNNEVNGDSEYTLLDNGRISIPERETSLNEDGEEVEEISYTVQDASGFVLEITKDFESTLDDLSDLHIGDLIVSLNSRWLKFKDIKSNYKVDKPMENNKFQKGLIYMDESGKSHPLTFIDGGTF